MLVLANIIGWITLNPKKVAYIVGIVLLLILSIMFYRGCSSGRQKLNEAQIQKLQKAQAENDRKAMEEVLIESELAEKAIDQNLANAKVQTVNAIAEAKKKAAQMSNDELAEYLNKKAEEQ